MCTCMCECGCVGVYGCVCVCVWVCVCLLACVCVFLCGSPFSVPLGCSFRGSNPPLLEKNRWIVSREQTVSISSPSPPPLHLIWAVCKTKGAKRCVHVCKRHITAHTSSTMHLIRQWIGVCVCVTCVRSVHRHVFSDFKSKQDAENMSNGSKKKNNSPEFFWFTHLNCTVDHSEADVWSNNLDHRHLLASRLEEIWIG